MVMTMAEGRSWTDVRCRQARRNGQLGRFGWLNLDERGVLDSRKLEKNQIKSESGVMGISNEGRDGTWR